MEFIAELVIQSKTAAGIYATDKRQKGIKKVTFFYYLCLMDIDYYNSRAPFTHPSVVPCDGCDCFTKCDDLQSIGYESYCPDCYQERKEEDEE